jgi:hypothetical protein
MSTALLISRGVAPAACRRSVHSSFDRRILRKSPSQVRLFETHHAWMTSELYDR